VAFALEPRVPQNPKIEPPLPAPRPPCLIGLNVNGLMYNGGYTRANMFGLLLDYPLFLRHLVGDLLADPRVSILLVPHTFAENLESDPNASRDLLQRLAPELARRVHLVTEA